MDKDEQWMRLLPLMKTVIKEMRSEWYRRVEDGLTHTQYHLLGNLHRHGRIKTTDLADMLIISNSTLSALADRMCERQLMIRERSEYDRRVVYLKITDKGQALLHTYNDIERLVFTKFFDRLSTEDLEQLEQIFLKLHQSS
jgi:DNA-binding MarR family transcriptional regulator